MTEDEKARMGIAAFGALGAAASLSFQRRERDVWTRIGRGGSSMVAGICTAVAVTPITGPMLESFFHLPRHSTDLASAALFGVTGYEMWKVIYRRAAKVLSGYIDKKSRDITDHQEEDEETPDKPVKDE